MASNNTKHQVSIQLSAYLESVRSIFFEDMIVRLAGEREMIGFSSVGVALCALGL